MPQELFTHESGERVLVDSDHPEAARLRAAEGWSASAADPEPTPADAPDPETDPGSGPAADPGDDPAEIPRPARRRRTDT